jgi:hypothetical protein
MAPGMVRLAALASIEISFAIASESLPRAGAVCCA